MSQGVVNAFITAGIDVYDRPTQLIDWVNADMFEYLNWSPTDPVYLCTRIRDHRVLITPEEVRIYSAPGVVS